LEFQFDKNLVITVGENSAKALWTSMTNDFGYSHVRPIVADTGHLDFQMFNGKGGGMWFTVWRGGPGFSSFKYKPGRFMAPFME
jgi:hypothetical protein